MQHDTAGELKYTLCLSTSCPVHYANLVGYIPAQATTKPQAGAHMDWVIPYFDGERDQSKTSSIQG